MPTNDEPRLAPSRSSQIIYVVKRFVARSPTMTVPGSVTEVFGDHVT
jgi:hypothetical protein